MFFFSPYSSRLFSYRTHINNRNQFGFKYYIVFIGFNKAVVTLIKQFFFSRFSVEFIFSYLMHPCVLYMWIFHILSLNVISCYIRKYFFWKYMYFSSDDLYDYYYWKEEKKWMRNIYSLPWTTNKKNYSYSTRRKYFYWIFDGWYQTIALLIIFIIANNNHHNNNAILWE